MVRQFSNPSSNSSSRGIAMLKVDQVGVRTRAQALALATRSATTTTSSAAKKRSRHVKISFKVRSNVVDRRRPPRLIIRSEGNISVPPTPELNPGDRTANEERCLSESLEDHALSTSCCSSNGSSSDERIKFADLEQDEGVEVETSVYYSSGSCRERETTPTSSELREESSSEAMDSTTKSTPEVKSHHTSSDAKILVTDEEVGKFFSEVEKNVPQHFKEKYNFDFDKDEPLEGRYEWVRLKP